jgi:hypothetical protein
MHEVFINHEVFLKEKEIPAVVKELIHKVMKSRYISIGHFLKSTSRLDLMLLAGCYEELIQVFLTEEEKDSFYCKSPAGSAYLLLTQILASGEGLSVPVTVSELIPEINYLKTYLMAESLSRIGFPIVIDYDHLTLSETNVKDRDLIQFPKTGIPTPTSPQQEAMIETAKSKVDYLSSMLKIDHMTVYNQTLEEIKGNKKKEALLSEKPEKPEKPEKSLLDRMKRLFIKKRSL